MKYSRNDDDQRTDHCKFYFAMIISVSYYSNPSGRPKKGVTCHFERVSWLLVGSSELNVRLRVAAAIYAINNRQAIIQQVCVHGS